MGTLFVRAAGTLSVTLFSFSGGHDSCTSSGIRLQSTLATEITTTNNSNSISNARRPGRTATRCMLLLVRLIILLLVVYPTRSIFDVQEYESPPRRQRHDANDADEEDDDDEGCGDRVNRVVQCVYIRR